MKWTKMWSGVVLSCVIGFSDASAQPTSDGGNSRQGAVTVTGCLEQGGAGGTIGTTGGVEVLGGASGTAGGAGGYVLAQAAVGESGRSPSAGAAATKGSAGDGRFILEGAKTDLQPHIGHRVEIVGRLRSPKDGGSASPTGGRGSSSAEPDSDRPRLQVESVRMIASECPSR